MLGWYVKVDYVMSRSSRNSLGSWSNQEQPTTTSVSSNTKLIAQQTRLKTL